MDEFMDVLFGNPPAPAPPLARAPCPASRTLADRVTVLETAMTGLRRHITRPPLLRVPADSAIDCGRSSRAGATALPCPLRQPLPFRAVPTTACYLQSLIFRAPSLQQCFGDMAEDFQLPSELLDDGFFNAFFADREGNLEEEKEDDLSGRNRQMQNDKLRPQARDLLNGAAGKQAALFELDDAERRRQSHHERWLLNLQILRLKQKQLLQQQPYAARTGISYGDSSSVGLPPLSRTPFLLQHQPHSACAARSVFLCRSGARKQSAGTGVFLPRTTMSKADPQKKSSAASSTVQTPARDNTTLPSGFANQNDTFTGRAVDAVRTHSHLQPAAIRTPMSYLPRKWN
ncbi:uncharacterized protein LOC122054832 [Zingiber officinale]|uniref:uncharacterized protein LOC122054832 n=1 Tax=Zingiber officinale TaxID=94328 RepID=UPI001C4D8170|nr:uncharacterized protein LOC122054832 [Zingiber officinale]